MHKSVRLPGVTLLLMLFVLSLSACGTSRFYLSVVNRMDNQPMAGITVSVNDKAYTTNNAGMVDVTEEVEAHATLKVVVDTPGFQRVEKEIDSANPFSKKISLDRTPPPDKSE